MPGVATRLALIDGNYFAHRFSRARPSRGRNGMPVGMLRAYALWFAELIADQRLSHLALILDHPEPSFRKDLFADYKAHRPPMPFDLRKQLEQLPALAALFGIKTYQIPGVEADDTMATIADRGMEAGCVVWLATSDKDIDQLLRKGLFTWDPLRNRLRSVNNLWEERGIRPDQSATGCAWSGIAPTIFPAFVASASNPPSNCSLPMTTSIISLPSDKASHRPAPRSLRRIHGAP